jgi:hypothetical protein
MGPLFFALQRFFVDILRRIEGDSVRLRWLFGKKLASSFRASASDVAGYCPMFGRSRSRPRTTNHAFRFLPTRSPNAGVISS